MDDEKKVRVGKIAGRALADTCQILATPESKRQEWKFDMARLAMGAFIAAIGEYAEHPTVKGVGIGIADVGTYDAPE